MTVEQATRRYFEVFIPSMIGYLAGSVGTVWAAEHLNLPPFALYVLASIPIFAMLAVFWGHWRFINEIDEFLRTIQIKAVLFEHCLRSRRCDRVGHVGNARRRAEAPSVLVDADFLGVLFRGSGGSDQTRRRRFLMKNRLKVLRAERNWSQAVLGDKLDVSRQTINAIEAGRYDPSLPLAFKIARLFGQTIEEIFDDDAGEAAGS